MDALLLVKASLILASALVAERLLRRAAANARHTLWSVGFAAVLALPLLATTLPALAIPMPSAIGRAIQPGADFQSHRPSGPATPSPVSVRQEDRSDPTESLTIPPGGRRDDGPSLVTVVPGVWILGLIAGAVALAMSLVRAHRLARSAEEMTDSAWQNAAGAIARRIGVRSPVKLLIAPKVHTPMAGGLLRAVIFLPGDAAGWSDERRDVVLMHEISHLARRDPLRHVLARLALACYWFHPLAWVAASRAAVAREQACDEAVLALGTRPSVYARVLLDLADALPSGGRQLAALPIVERSRLENRLMAILDHDLRPASTRRVFLPVAGAILLLLPVAAAQPLVRAAPAPPATPDANFEIVQPPVVPISAQPTTAPATPVPISEIAQPPVVPAAAEPTTTAAALFARGVQLDRSRDSACWSDGGRNASFSGSISTSETGGRTIIHEQVGWRGADRVIQKTFGDLTVCMLAEEFGSRDGAERPSQWIGRASRVLMEAHRGTAIQRLELARQSGGGIRTSWQVGGRERRFDREAQAWQDGMLAALDTTWEISMLRGEVSSLRGEISSIFGQRSSLQGEISSLNGEISSMRGRISSARGEESSLRGQISSIRGHLSSLQGAISSENGAISSLNASRYGADSTDRARIASRVAGHDAEIARLEREIRDYNADARVAAVEKELAALDTDRKVAAIEREIRAFNLDAKVAEIQRRIAALDVDGKVAGIEKQIAGLDADARVRRLEGRRDDELKRLEAAIAAIR